MSTFLPMEGEGLGGVSGWIMGAIETSGYPGLAGIVAAESVILPLPSEMVLPLAGFLAGRGQMSFPGAVAAATVGSLIGALFLYGLGRALGEDRIRELVRRWGRYVLLEPTDVARASSWFHRYGTAAVFFGRLVPVVRSLISLPAGVHGMALPRFCAYTVAGSLVWNTALIGAGWILGDRWLEVQQYARLFEWTVLVVIVAMLGMFVARRTVLRRRPA